LRGGNVRDDADAVPQVARDVAIEAYAEDYACLM
jgi:hypothetical protein